MKKFLLTFLCCLLTAIGLQAAEASYVKVTEALTDWSGDYLIVYEDGKVAFNGGLTKLDAVSNTISVTINNGEIAASDVVNSAKFTIAKTGTGYTIKSASGYYIGRESNSNGLDSGTATAYNNTISFTNGNVKIEGSYCALQYNKTSGQTRFRYFKSSQQSIALYKYTEVGSGGEITLGAIKANGSEATDLTVYANSEVVFSAENAESISYTVNGGDAVVASSWTPTEVGSYTVVVTATLASKSDTQTFNVTVEEAPATQTVTTDFSAQGYTNALEITTVNNPPVTFTFDKGTNSNAPKYYTDGAAVRVYGGGYVNVAVTEEYVLTKVVITYGSGDGSNDITVDNGTFATDTWTATAETSEVTFTIGGTKGNRRFKEMEVTYALKGSETPDTREEVTLTFSETECSAVYGDAFMEPTLAVNPETAAEEVKYSSSNTEVATVDGEGKVSILAAGETTITAAIKDSETYKDVEVSYTLTVIELGAIMFNDFVLDEGHMCGAFVGTPVTISAANAEAMSYTIDGGDLVEVEGSSFTWTPEAVGEYSFSVSAYLGGQDKTVNFTVTVEEQPVGPEIEYPAYIRINQAPVNNNWAGRYLIVYEDGNVAFDGSLETLDEENNNCNVTISEGYIKATDELANSEFTIAAIEGSENAWSVKSASNVYIGRSTDANELDESETELQNTISFNVEDRTVNIIGKGGAYLRYNSASNQNRFRYYKTSSYTNQKPIALYRYAANKDDDATAIEEVEAIGSEAGEAQWYDMNGRRVAAPGKGIYILKQGNKATKYAF